MIKQTYLGEKTYFEDLEDLKRYYYELTSVTLEDISEDLKSMYDGMEYPILEEL